MMRTLLLVALALLVAAPPSPAQRENTIYEPMFTEEATETTAQLVNNIGQSQHVVEIIMTDAPAQTCVGHSVDIVLERAFDTAGPWIRFGAPLSSVADDGQGNIFGEVRANGAFPFLRLNLDDFDTVKCRVTAKYSGTLFPFALISQIPKNTETGMLQTTIDTTTTGDNTLVAANANADVKVCVYMLLLYNETAQALTFKSDAVEIIPVMEFGSKAGLLLPASGNFYFCTLGGDALILNLGGATQVSGLVLTRYE